MSFLCLSSDVKFVFSLCTPDAHLWPPLCRCKLRTDARVRDLYRIGRTLGTGGALLPSFVGCRDTGGHRSPHLFRMHMYL